jgi:site-specific DNA recombinase
MKVAAYCRVSSEEQRDRETIDLQRTELERFFRDEGYSVADWYLDDGVSGDVPFEKRPAGTRLIEDARAGRFKGVVVIKIDRLSRRTEDSLRVIRVLHEELGLVFRCSAQPIELNSSTGRFMLTMLAGFAEFEKSQILERTRSGYLRRLKSGKWPRGKPPYGYSVIPAGEDAGCLEINPGEAAIVHRIFTWYREGWGMDKIALTLEAQGVPTPRQGQRWKQGQRTHWGHNAIASILNNSIYTGEAVHNRTRVVRQDGRAIGRRQTEPEEHMPLSAPQIVAPEVFAEVQGLKIQHRQEATRNMKRLYLLRGKIRCGCCGNRYFGLLSESTREGKKYSYPYYRCGTYWSRNQTKCPNVQVRADKLEAAAWARVRRSAQNPEPYLADLRAELEAQAGAVDASQATDDLTTLEKQIAALEEERRNARRAHRKGIYGAGRESDQALEEALSEIGQQERALRDEGARLRALLGNRIDVETAVSDTESLLRQIRESLAAAEGDERLRMKYIQLLFEDVVVSPQRNVSGKGRKVTPLIEFRVAPVKAASGRSAVFANYVQSIKVDGGQMP